MSDEPKPDLGSLRDELIGGERDVAEQTGLMGRIGSMFSRKPKDNPEDNTEPKKDPATVAVSEAPPDAPKDIEQVKTPAPKRALFKKPLRAKIAPQEDQVKSQEPSVGEGDEAQQPAIDNAADTVEPKSETPISTAVKAETFDDAPLAEPEEFIPSTAAKTARHVAEPEEPTQELPTDPWDDTAPSDPDTSEDVAEGDMLAAPEPEPLAMEEPEKHTEEQEPSPDDFLAALRRLNTEQSEAEEEHPDTNSDPDPIEEDASEDLTLSDDTGTLDSQVPSPARSRRSFAEVADATSTEIIEVAADSDEDDQPPTDTEIEPPSDGLDIPDAEDTAIPETVEEKTAEDSADKSEAEPAPNYASAVFQDDQKPSATSGQRTANISVTIDNERLEDLVAEMIRQELTGPLGTQITEIIRAYVEAEVARIVEERGPLPGEGK